MLEELCLRVRALCENTLTLVSAWRENGLLALTSSCAAVLDLQCPKLYVSYYVC